MSQQAQAKKSKNPIILTAQKFKELLDNGTITFESAQIYPRRKPINLLTAESNSSCDLNSAEQINNSNISENNDAVLQEDEPQHTVYSTTSKYSPQEMEDVIQCESLTCLVCGLEFSKYMFLTRHYTTEHPGDPMPIKFTCKDCPYMTGFQMNMIYHRRTHTGVKPYACDVCPKRFTSDFNLTKHKVVHTGERNFLCKHCDKRFTQSGSLKNHIKTVHLKIPNPAWQNRKRCHIKKLN